MNKVKILCLAASLVILSCQGNKSDKAVVEGSFVASPQALPNQEVNTLRIGSRAPDFNLPNIDGKFYSLEDFKSSEVLVIIFTCNHCPTAQAYEDRIISVTSDYKDKSVQMLAISPNSPLGLLYEELGYSDLNDDYEEMKIRHADMSFNFPYLYDGDDHAASLLYGPVATPHVFVFDKERTLQYVGRLDSSEKPGTANAEDLRAAIDALLLGQKPTLAETKTFGCSTKWAWKTELKDKVDKEWAAKAISVKTISKEGIGELLKNEKSEKLLLINVWATWCGPCVLEYPEFIKLHRMFGARDFEFVSISADNQERSKKVIEFLTKAQSAIVNYQFDTDNKYELIEAIDPNWNGALPYTLLIEPGGNVFWAHQGEVDFYELKKVIVEHPMIGRVY